MDHNKKISVASRATVMSSKKVSRTEPCTFQLDLNSWDANQKFEEKLRERNYNPRQIIDAHKKGEIIVAVPSAMGIKKSIYNQSDDNFNKSNGEINHAFVNENEVTRL